MKIKTKRYYLYYLACIGGFLVAILPFRLGLFLAEIAGKVIFKFEKKSVSSISAKVAANPYCAMELGLEVE